MAGAVRTSSPPMKPSAGLWLDRIAGAVSSSVQSTQRLQAHGIRVLEASAVDIEQGTATLIGNVRITRGQNQLNGEVAEVNLNTGVSRLLSGPQSRTRALVVPNREPQQPQTKPGG